MNAGKEIYLFFYLSFRFLAVFKGLSALICGCLRVCLWFRVSVGVGFVCLLVFLW